MKLAILGSEHDLLTLAAAAVSAGHSIAWLGDIRADDAPYLSKVAPDLANSRDWESLLDRSLADAVLIGHGAAPDELRAEQLKRFATDAVPMLVVQPCGTSVLPYYEVDMARRESHGIVRHYTPQAGSPVLAELASWVQTGTGTIGQVHQVICQRLTTDRGRESVLHYLARDVEVLRDIAGDIRTVNAVGPKPSDANYTTLQVQMTTRGAATLRWSVAPATDGPPRSEWTLIGEHGTARLILPVNALSSDAHPPTSAGELITNVAGHAESKPVAHWDAPQAAIDALAAALPANGSEQSEAASTWQHATAAMEVVDAIELSLQKGRTIEVLPQQLTEQLAFRGTMAAFGCALLLIGMIVMVVVSVIGGAETFLHQKIIGSWPVLLLAVLMFFLLLQAFPWLAAKRRSPGPKHDDEPPAGDSN